MFLDLTMKKNPKLIETAFRLHQEGYIQPDTYVLDLDAIVYNGRAIKEEADRYDVRLYFMTKQFGRNPYVAAELMKIGYEGAVAVDYREAAMLHQNGIRLGHVGHLVQIPSNQIEAILEMRPEVITVYSVEKAREIAVAAKKIGMTQKVLMKVIDHGDLIFPGQDGGFYFSSLADSVKELLRLPNLELAGLTSFPCFTVDKDKKVIHETNNLNTLLKAKTFIAEKFNINVEQMNTPSVTCTSSIKIIAKSGGTHGEPGHGLSGTTPIHALTDQVELPASVYVSEVSHNLNNYSYCYGGGHYRRSFMNGAIVGKDMTTAKRLSVEAPDDSTIDYYIGLKENALVGDTAIFAFRTQIFVTRSEVAIVKGISTGDPQIVGIYDSQGQLIRGDA